jgi:hypothetical protein
MEKGTKILTWIFIIIFISGYISFYNVSAQQDNSDSDIGKIIGIYMKLQSFWNKLFDSGAQEWQERYTKNLEKRVTELTEKNNELQLKISELEGEITQIRYEPANQEKPLTWFNQQTASRENEIKSNEETIKKNTENIEKIKSRIIYLEKIGSTFASAWGFIRFLLIPLILVYLIRDVLLTFISEVLDRITKIPIAGTLKTIISFGKGGLGTLIWFGAMLIAYISILGGTFVESWIGRMLLFLTIFIMDLFSLSAEKTNTIYLVIGVSCLIIIGVVALLYTAISKGIQKSREEKRDLTVKKLGRDIKALKETAAATAKGIRD